jgi:hypothetical protein
VVNVYIYYKAARIQVFGGGNTLPSIRSTSYPTTLIVGESFFFLLGLFIHSSLMSLLYMGTSLMACMSGILTHKLLRFPMCLFSTNVYVLLVFILSGYGGVYHHFQYVSILWD